MMDDVTLHLGDALKVLPSIPSASVDCCITDPPYPCIKRSYGYWTEAEWFAMMRGVVPEVMRTLKPSGSAVFILQPNSERVGRMRTWLWEFMLWVGKEWGIVQDAWWWNVAAMPEAHAIQGRLMRPSLKACVWIGYPNCYRNQDAALWPEALVCESRRRSERFEGRKEYTSGHGKRASIYDASRKRGGVTPFNVMPAGSDGRWGGGTNGHGAGTPLALCSWWTRYLCPPGGKVLDPFAGSGTTALAALKHGASWIGVEKVPEYVAIARKRIAEAQAATPLFNETVTP